MVLLTTREVLNSEFILSYNSNLDKSGSFTSDSFHIEGKKEIRVYAHNEGASGITIAVEQSLDGENWYNIPIARGENTGASDIYGVWEVVGKYARVVETNNDSSNAQTANMVMVTLA